MPEESTKTMELAGEEIDFSKADLILKEFKGKKGIMVPVLQRIQEEYDYLPRPVLEYVSKKMRIPVSRVYGVATFYAQFHLKPRGKYIIRVCRGTACHVRGSAKIASRIKDTLNIDVGETTPDLKFTLEEVACIGACGLAPVMMINENTHGRLTPDKVKKILKQY